jgi:hypothetical protein
MQQMSEKRGPARGGVIVIVALLVALALYALAVLQLVSP